MRIALDLRRFRHDPSFLHQRLHDLMRRIALLRQLRDGYRLPRIREQCDRRSLQRRFLFQRLDFFRRNFPREPREEPHLVPDLGFADDIWQHALHRRFQ